MSNFDDFIKCALLAINISVQINSELKNMRSLQTPHPN